MEEHARSHHPELEALRKQNDELSQRINILTDEMKDVQQAHDLMLQERNDLLTRFETVKKRLLLVGAVVEGQYDSDPAPNPAPRH